MRTAVRTCRPAFSPLRENGRWWWAARPPSLETTTGGPPRELWRVSRSGCETATAMVGTALSSVPKTVTVDQQRTNHVCRLVGRKDTGTRTSPTLNRSIRLTPTRRTTPATLPGWKQVIPSSAYGRAACHSLCTAESTGRLQMTRRDEPPSGLGDCPILPVPPFGEDRSGTTELSGGADRHASCCGDARHRNEG